ncbi:6-phospho-3-hexuloisomerase [Methanohalophilus levihalophilus]|uniref:6-phospho-3-hexuloisomerase n=1 Tax=Methanohalophilus levihalophilus TaxID=1431282 RepID=UPI001AE2FAF3|nr:6-phospho-3-hexuloisomerase [Methanohalophilus levihalophilus]MBP2030626.1 6-phospho-3-hexuloisomerase [Methanohalophilus levihalophilus]
MKERTSCDECDHLISSMELMANHLLDVAGGLDQDSIKQAINNIFDARAIFVMGAGRSGLVGKAFAMRLMHLGFTSYVVGESTTPAVHKEDLVVAISGSGETRSISDLGHIAKEIGATLLTITSNKDSTLGRISDTVAEIAGRTKDDAGGYLERHMKGEYTHLTPLGTSFEITSLVFLDALIAELIYITGASEADLKSRHAKLE